MSSAINSSPAPLASLTAGQQAFISGGLHTTLTFRYLLGIYSGLYVVTTYIYLYKGHASTSQKALVISTLTALYIALAAMDLINWYSVTIFTASGYSDQLSIMTDILEDTSFILSDWLMIWRCFHACGREFTRFALPLGLFIAEFTLVICQIALQITRFKNHAMYTQQNSHGAIMPAAIFGTAAATSLTSTFTICKTIYSKTIPGGHFRARFKYIANILLQSSAIYSTLMLLSFLSEILRLWKFTVGVQISKYFIVNLAFGMTGFIPTLMVARLAIGAEEKSTECFSEGPRCIEDRPSCDMEAGP